MIREINSFIDYTYIPEVDENFLSLVTFKKTKRICEIAKEEMYRGVCVRPELLGVVRNNIVGDNIQRAVVIGFPDKKIPFESAKLILGVMPKEKKYEEMKISLLQGATEFDYVLNQIDIHSKNHKKITEEIEGALKIADGRKTKFIIESGLLSTDEITFICKLIIMSSEMSFLSRILTVGLQQSKNDVVIKTSTGYLIDGPLVNLDDVRLIKKIINKSNVEIKASGGIRTRSQVLNLLKEGVAIVGTSGIQEETYVNN